MFRAIAKYLRAAFLFLTGKIDAFRKRMYRNPNVMRAGYDQVIEDKEQMFIQFKDNLGDQVRRHEEKIDKLKKLTEEIQELEKHRQGSAYMAKERVAKLKAEGKTDAEIEDDEEYKFCFEHFNRCVTSLEEKQIRIHELEEDIQGYSDRIASTERQLKTLNIELSQLKDEADDAVTDVLTDNQEQRRADVITGVSQEANDKLLKDMREARRKSSADAKVAMKLADMDTKQQQADFLEYAKSGVARQEFKSIVGLGGKEALEHDKLLDTCGEGEEPKPERLKDESQET
jgi:hypothetical protein